MLTKSDGGPLPSRVVPLQLTPDFKYSIYLGADRMGPLLADVFVVNANAKLQLGSSQFVGGAGGTEFWFYSTEIDIIQRIESTSSIFVDVKQLSDDPNFDPKNRALAEKQCTANRGLWPSIPKTYEGSGARSFSFWTNTPGGTAKCWGLELNINNDPSSGIKSLNGAQWYRYDSSADFFSGTVIETDGFIGEWKQGKNWSGASPYIGNGYFAEASI